MKSSSIYTLLAALLLCVSSARAGEEKEKVHVPEWAKGAVWYQIFPERFRNGDPANDPTKEEVLKDEEREWKITPWTSNWYEMADWELARSDNFYREIYHRRYGGDLIGVIEKLDYLQDLGVTAIYFNPIFEAHSLHKYDARAYHHIDNNFGADRDGDMQLLLTEKKDTESWAWSSADSVFLELLDQAHARGIRVIIDGVWNHVGREFWAFQDVLKKQQDSMYKSWFQIDRWDDQGTPEDEMEYDSWWDTWYLVEFREDERGIVPEVRDHIWAATRRWMDPNGDGDPSDGIDGWRLDVVPDVAKPFWHDWGAYTRTINPDVYLTAEIWEVAEDYIANDCFTSMMNYPFAYATMNFFVNQKERKITANQFAERLDDLLKVYQWDVMLNMMNLVDSHDTDRIASIIRNPDRQYDRDSDLRANPDYNVFAPTPAQKQVQVMIAAFQATFPGSPMIYYGDEAGMWGSDDPDDRKPMVWPDLEYEDETYASIGKPGVRHEVKFDHHLHAQYKKIFNLRGEHPALRTGRYQAILADDARSLFGFKRVLENDVVLAYFNNSKTAQMIELPREAARMKDALGNQITKKAGTSFLHLPAKTAGILVK